MALIVVLLGLCYELYRIEKAIDDVADSIPSEMTVHQGI